MAEAEEVMFASRDLDTLYLPPSFHSPSLHTVPGRGLVWFWRADAVYLSWMLGVVARAGSTLSPNVRDKADAITSAICIAYGITDDNAAALVPPPGSIKLPTDILADSVGLCDSYVGPAWDGIDRCAAACEYASPLRTAVFDVDAYRETMRNFAWFAKQKKSRRKT